VPGVKIQEKKWKVAFLKSLEKGVGSGSITQRYGLAAKCHGSLTLHKRDSEIIVKFFDMVGHNGTAVLEVGNSGFEFIRWKVKGGRSSTKTRLSLFLCENNSISITGPWVTLSQAVEVWWTCLFVLRPQVRQETKHAASHQQKTSLRSVAN